MREEFETLPEIAEIIKEGVFWDGEIYRRTAICKLTHLYYVRGAWYAWQAKAKAVPEGLVLVNKKDLVKVLNCVTDDWLVDTDSFEEFKKIESLVQDEVNAMIDEVSK